MQNLFLTVLVWLLLTGSLLADIRLDSSSYRANGVLNPFWRIEPVIGEWLSNGQGLVTIPDYLSKTSFPYQKRPYAKEVDFADELIVVRLLGGWHSDKKNSETEEVTQADLVYRDQSGALQYRWDLLAKRLDPYLANGYKRLTLVLDNIPWSLTSSPKQGLYGQTAPPDDMTEWAKFIEALCTQLVNRYGHGIVDTWRFRIGTENQSKKRFSGTQQDYQKMYDHAATAINKVLPRAKIGPFNQAGGKSQPERNNVNYLALVDHCAKGKNYATGEIGSPLDFIAISSYMSMSQRKTIGMPISKKFAQTNSIFFDTAGRLKPDQNKPTREVHEFGMLEKVDQGVTLEMGVYGAVGRFNVMFEMWESGIDRVAHWRTLEKLRGTKDNLLMNGEGWLYSILEYAKGGYVSVQDIQSEQTQSFYKSIKIDLPKRDIYLVSRLDDSRSAEPESVVLLTENQLSNQVRIVRLNKNTSVYDVIRSDLDKDQIKLSYRGHPERIGRVKDMVTKSGVSQITSDWARYQNLMVDALTLSKRGYQVGADKIEFTMSSPELVAIVIEEQTKQ